MQRILTLGALILALHSGLLAATLTFPARVAVRGDEVRLGEVATVDGTPDEQARLQAVVLGASPSLGQSREYTPGMIRSRLQQQGWQPDTLTINSPASIRITRLATDLDGDTLLAMAQAWLQGRLQAGEGEELTLTPTRTPANLHLPDGVVSYVCSMAGSETGSLRLVQVAVQVDGRVVWRGVVAFQVQRLAPVLVAKAQITRGTHLTASLFTREMRDVTALRGTPLREETVLRDCRAAQGVSAGAVLTAAVVEAIPLVKREDTVQIRAVCGAFVVHTLAVACEDGTLGTRIRVRNPQTKQEFTARVTGPGELELVR